VANRAVSVDETFTLPAPVRAKLADDLGGTSPGEVLGAVLHNPTDAEEISSLSTTTQTALKSAVLAVTFTAPSSGNVTVDLNAWVNECSELGYWSLLSGGSVVPGSLSKASGPKALNSGDRCHVTSIITGLNPGQSYTYEWAGSHSTGNFRVRAGGTSTGSSMGGPMTMVVRDAPFA
jgi:hypothetical protein